MFQRLLLAVFALFFVCGAIASPVPAPLDASSSNANELEERSSYRTGGQGTYFYPGLGACGWTNKSSDKIVALSSHIYSKSHCGKMISITSEGKTHTAKIVDECPGCATNSLDMSPSLFTQFASESKGVISIKWKFL